mgnify:CR=1 FL=1
MDKAKEHLFEALKLKSDFSKADQNLSMNEDGGSSNIAMVNVDGDKNINVINQEGARSFVNMGMGNKINMMQMQGYFTV